MQSMRNLLSSSWKQTYHSCQIGLWRDQLWPVSDHAVSSTQEHHPCIVTMMSHNLLVPTPSMSRKHSWSRIYCSLWALLRESTSRERRRIHNMVRLEECTKWNRTLSRRLVISPCYTYSARSYLCATTTTRFNSSSTFISNSSMVRFHKLCVVP